MIVKGVKGSSTAEAADSDIKRWGAKRTAQVVVDILKGTTTAAEVARRRDLTASEVEGWIEEGLAGKENGLRARPRGPARGARAQARRGVTGVGRGLAAGQGFKKTEQLFSSADGVGAIGGARWDADGAILERSPLPSRPTGSSVSSRKSRPGGPGRSAETVRGV